MNDGALNYSESGRLRLHKVPQLLALDHDFERVLEWPATEWLYIKGTLSTKVKRGDISVSENKIPTPVYEYAER